MTKRDASFVRFADKPISYKAWGEVRRKNMIARIMSGMVMTLMGLAVLAGLAIIALFAASVAVIGAVAIGAIGLTALFTRKPAEVRIPAEDGKGIYEARQTSSSKTGSTWTVY